MRVITEGQIQAGDQIVKTRTGPHALTVADTDALLYLPGRDPAQARQRCADPRAQPRLAGLVPRPAGRGRGPTAPPPGPAGAAAGPGLGRVPPAAGGPGGPRERDGVLDLPGRRRTAPRCRAARPGQYLTLRVAGAGHPAPVRSYSLSSAPGRQRLPDQRQARAARRRQQLPEPRPAARARSWTWPRPAATSSSTTAPAPVLLISAGIGVTPVLAMLHELAARRSEREVWWLHGARGPQEHPLAAEAHALLASLPHAREHVFYSAATPAGTPAAATPRRAPDQRQARRARPARRRERLHLRAGLVHGRHAATRWPRSASARTAIHTELFGALPSSQPRADRADPPAAAPAARPARNRAAW